MKNEPAKMDMVKQMFREFALNIEYILVYIIALCVVALITSMLSETAIFWSLGIGVSILLIFYIPFMLPHQLDRNRFHGFDVPFHLVRDKYWRKTMDCLRVGNRMETEEYSDILLIIKHRLFKTDASGDLRDYDVVLDKENAILWKKLLTEGPLLERMELLATLNGEDAVKTFEDMDKAKLDEFFKPLKEFSDYIKKVHTDKGFRWDELSKVSTGEHSKRIEMNNEQRLVQMSNDISKGLDATLKVSTENN